MKNITNLEIIDISSKDGKLVAILSYQDTDKLFNFNNGYNTMDIPVNIRELQKSDRGNVLLDQSIKGDEINES